MKQQSADRQAFGEYARRCHVDTDAARRTWPLTNIGTEYWFRQTGLMPALVTMSDEAGMPER